MLHSWTESDFEGFTQNGCYGNQSQPLELLFDSTDASNPCPFTKQDLIFKQAYLVGFCFVLFNKLKFWQLVLVFSVLYRLYLEITLFCTKPSEQIVYCHVTDVKMLKKLVYWIALRKQPSFFAPGPEWRFVWRTSAIHLRKFHTDDVALSRIWSWALIGSIGNYA